MLKNVGMFMICNDCGSDLSDLNFATTEVYMLAYYSIDLLVDSNQRFEKVESGCL